MNFSNVFLDVIFPKRCVFCEKELAVGYPRDYCDDCYCMLPFPDENRCLICDRQLLGEYGYRVCPGCQVHKMHFDKNYSCFIYEGAIQEAIKRFKFSDKMWYAKPFSEFIFERIKNERFPVEYITYPPINKAKFKERGYNQSELIAVKLAKLIKKPVIKGAIIKTRENETQSLLSASERFENVRGVFEISKKAVTLINGKSILFIDDVLTTGATASECAKTLKKAGAKTVYMVTLSITR